MGMIHENNNSIIKSKNKPTINNFNYSYLHIFLDKIYQKKINNCLKNFKKYTKKKLKNEIIELKLDFSYIYEINISKNNSFIVIRNKNGQIKIIEFPNFKVKKSYLINKKTIINTNLSSKASLFYSGKKIALLTTHSDNSVLLWDLNGKILSSLFDNKNTLIQSCFHNSNKSFHTLYKNSRWSLWDIETSRMIISRKFFKTPAISMDLNYFYKYLLLCSKKKLILVNFDNLNNATYFDINCIAVIKKAKFCNITDGIFALTNKKNLYYLNQRLKKFKISLQLQKFIVSDFATTIAIDSYLSTICVNNVLKIWKINEHLYPVNSIFHKSLIISTDLNVSNFIISASSDISCNTIFFFYHNK